MKNMQSHSGSYLSVPIPPRAGRDFPYEFSPEWTVILWNQRQSDRRLITHLVEDCKIQTCWIDDFSAIAQAECSCHCSIAVVALGVDPSARASSLQVIRSLAQKGFKVIGYEEAAHTWPLGIRCQALLAGASWLLDSAEADFAQELQRVLAQLLQTEAGRQNEEERIRSTMRKLGIVGESPAMLSVFQQVLRVSTLSDIPVLIRGETGTGKDLLAHALHQLDRKRCHGPFVALNCGAISPSLAESELFGHRRGAFTGAERDRKGLIRAAEGGVLFMDEIGELDDTLQVKLLRVLQEHHVLGVGEDQEVSVSVRVIAATHRNLDEMVQQKLFRADLLHRLDVLSIHIPPLRERPADLKPLIEHLLKKNCSLQRAESLSVGSDFVEALRQIGLSGNARQVENLLRRTLLNKEDDTPLTLRDLPSEVWQQLLEQNESALARSKQENGGQNLCQLPPETPLDLSSHLVNLLDTRGWNLSQALQYCERVLLEAALRLKRGNQSQTARLLGITSRSVYSKIRRYHLDSWAAGVWQLVELSFPLS